MKTGKLGTARRRWPRGQKFTLSTTGADAARAYGEAVSGARASGRQALDAALSAWAEPRLVAPGDGVVLSELSGKQLGLSHLTLALETTGIVPEEVRDALGRLADAGLVELVPLASQLAQAR